MEAVTLEATSLRVSRFAFGTGNLHHIGDLNSQADHLRAAFDAGFTHFDTAPLYGFGLAEKAIGLAFGDPTASGVTVTTKVGLFPPGGRNQSRRTVMVRKALGKVVPALTKPRVDWSIERARDSLETSLFRLRRDRIDLFLLHEPDFDLLVTDEWQKWFESEVGERIGAFGICGETERLLPFLNAGSMLTRVLQSCDSLEGSEADSLAKAGKFPQITYGYVSRATEGVSPLETFRYALKRNKDGAIIVSTRNRSRLGDFAEILDASVSS